MIFTKKNMSFWHSLKSTSDAKNEDTLFFFPVAKVIWGVSSPQRSPGAPIAPQVQMILFADVIEGFHEWNIDKCCRFWHLWQFRSLEEIRPGILESNLLKFTNSLRCWLFLFCSLCLSTPRCSQCWWNHRGSSSFAWAWRAKGQCCKLFSLKISQQKLSAQGPHLFCFSNLSSWCTLRLYLTTKPPSPIPSNPQILKICTGHF